MIKEDVFGKKLKSGNCLEKIIGEKYAANNKK
jgi:hypothetical protein